MSHATVGALTGAEIHYIQLDRMAHRSRISVLASCSCGIFLADEGGATFMSGGVPWLTLPAGYLGSSLIGAALVTCGFNMNASKVAVLALTGFFLFTLWWARKSVV
jgi:hypothetical protein